MTQTSKSHDICDIFLKVVFVVIVPCVVALLGYGTEAERAALPIHIRECSISVCPNNGMSAIVSDF